jgi:DNA-binding PadR family transcriptional regulator
MKKTADDHVDSIVHELRRGVLVLAILGRLGEERYGYALREDLRDRGLDVPEGTLYPLLRRLESQGLLESRWQMGEGRPRRYYRRSALGNSTLKKLVLEWGDLVEVMAALAADGA